MSFPKDSGVIAFSFMSTLTRVIEMFFLEINTTKRIVAVNSCLEWYFVPLLLGPF